MKKILVLPLFLMFSGYVHAQSLVVKSSKGSIPPPQLGISPPRIEDSLAIGTKKSLNQSIIIYNYSPKPKKIKIKLVDLNNRNKIIKPNKSRLSAWTILNPASFTIPGDGQQTVRLSIRPPLGFPKKTHRAMLKVEQFVPEQVKFDKDGKGATVTLGANYGLPLIIRIK